MFILQTHDIQNVVTTDFSGEQLLLFAKHLSNTREFMLAYWAWDSNPAVLTMVNIMS